MLQGHYIKWPTRAFSLQPHLCERVGVCCAIRKPLNPSHFCSVISLSTTYSRQAARRHPPLPSQSPPVPQDPLRPHLLPAAFPAADTCSSRTIRHIPLLAFHHPRSCWFCSCQHGASHQLPKQSIPWATRGLPISQKSQPKLKGPHLLK